jgi:hypothetical protein
MSRHRAADSPLNSGLAERIEELARQAAVDRAVVPEPQLADVHQHIDEVADVVRQAMVVMAEFQRTTEERYAAQSALLDAQARRADSAVATAQAARETLKDTGAELLTQVKEARNEFHGSAGILTGAQAVLEAGVRRVQTSGDALVRYLDDRDVALEAERDRILRDVLEDFAESLNARERRSIAKRLVGVVDRRRDARDAGRWRREHGVEPGQPPLDLTTRDERIAQAGGARPGVIDLDAAAQQRRMSPRR